MENSNLFNRQFHNFLGDNLSSSQVSTELQLKCSSDISHITPQTTLPSCTSYFQVSTKPGPNSLTEVTITEVRKTQFLTSSSTLDRLLSFNQDSSLFCCGDSQEFRLISPHQNSPPFRREEAKKCRPPPLLSLQYSPLRGESQNSLPKVLKNEPIELNFERDISPPPGFSRKFGPNGASVIPKDHFLPSHQDSSISLGRETQKKFHVPQTEPNNKDEPNSATKISPPPGFSNKNGIGGASAKNFDLNEEYNEQNRADGRIHSLPHAKYGPYKCPQCLTIYPTSQHYAAHVSARHRAGETLVEKKKRHVQKFKNRKYKMVQSPDGLTVVEDQSSNPIDDEVEVVLSDKVQNGVVLYQEIRSHLREKKDDTVKLRTGISGAGKGHLDIRVIKTKEEIVEALRGPFVRDLGKRRSLKNWKEEVRSSSSHDHKRNAHWKGPFGYLKRTKPY